MQSIKLVDSNTPCLYIRKQGDRQTYIYRYKRNQKKVVHKVGDVGVDNKRDMIKLAREMNLRRSFGMEVVDGSKVDENQLLRLVKFMNVQFMNAKTPTTSKHIENIFNVLDFTKDQLPALLIIKLRTLCVR